MEKETKSATWAGPQPRGYVRTLVHTDMVGVTVPTGGSYTPTRSVCGGCRTPPVRVWAGPVADLAGFFFVLFHFSFLCFLFFPFSFSVQFLLLFTMV
jgi:hypothetical protein